jgi:hypothetical protein
MPLWHIEAGRHAYRNKGETPRKKGQIPEIFRLFCHPERAFDEV